MVPRTTFSTVNTYRRFHGFVCLSVRLCLFACFCSRPTRLSRDVRRRVSVQRLEEEFAAELEDREQFYAGPAADGQRATFSRPLGDGTASVGRASTGSAGRASTGSGRQGSALPAAARRTAAEQAAGDAAGTAK